MGSRASRSACMPAITNTMKRAISWSRRSSGCVAGNIRSSVAILYRSNAQSRVLEEALIRSGIPYRIYGGQRFYERLEIRNALAYLRLLLNRGDDAALERVINTPPRGIGSKSLDTVRECARNRGITLWSAIAAVRKKSCCRPGRSARWRDLSC